MNTYETVKQAEPAEALEALIDAHGLARVVEIIANVCDEKAEHLSLNWQEPLASSNWRKMATKLHKLQVFTWL